MNEAPIFQHRHYKAIAAMLADAQGMAFTANGWAELISEVFAEDNPRFDRARFLAAANGKPSNSRDKVRP